MSGSQVKDTLSESTECNNIKENKKAPTIQILSPSDAKVLLFFEASSFWGLAWVGTVFSGALFAASEMLFKFRLTEALLPFFVGGILIGICAIPIIITFAIGTWALWLTPFRIYNASLAGGLSCVIAAVTFLNATHTYLTDGWQLIAFEGLSGGIGCPLIIYLLGRRWFFPSGTSRASKTPWQFTLKELLVHFTVLAVLISVWTCSFSAFWSFVSRSGQIK